MPTALSTKLGAFHGEGDPREPPDELQTNTTARSAAGATPAGPGGGSEASSRGARSRASNAHSWSNSTFAALLAGAAAFACSSHQAPGNDEATMGTLGLALTVEGYAVSQVQVNIRSENVAPEVNREREFDVSDPNATISATEYGLPRGQYTVVLSATVADDPATDLDETTIDCTGAKEGVTVEAGVTTNVHDLVLLCTVDGGELQVGGGINIEAQAEIEVVNTCPDLIAGAFVAPLHTSVESSVQLVAEPADDVSVTWSASAGSIAADGASYTCPATAGVYTVTARFIRDAECDQLFTEQVHCHNDYDGVAATLPSAFSFTGDCNLANPCHITQNGKEWSAVCGSRPDRLTQQGGEADGENSFPFLSGTRVCSGSVVDGEFVGTCTNADGTSCSFASDSTPDPTVSCPTISELRDVQTCAGQYEACAVAQEGCNILAKCGDTYLGRNVTPDGSVRLEDYSGSQLVRCQAPTVNGTAAGTCNEVGGDLSCEYSATIVEAPSACEETLSGGFVLEGCDFDDVCVAQQQGCAWRIICSSGVYSDLATGTNTFEFVGPNGSSCAGGVVDGQFEGSCGSGDTACTFHAREAVAGMGCINLPATLTARGCGFGSPTAFEAVQDGCKFAGYAPSRGVGVAGDATADGISFGGIAPGWQCEATVSSEVPDEMWGGCTRDNDDGTVSQCRDLGDPSRLVLKL